MPTQKTSFLNQYLKIEYILLTIIFVIFIVTRFYNLDKRIIFGWDQEQFSTQIRDIVVNHNFTLLGPRVTNDLGFFLAPYLTYFLVPFYLLTNLHPFALFYWTILVNILFFIVSFITLKRLFSIKHALWFLTFWTLHSLAQIYDSTPWWPQIIPLGVMITLLIISYVKDNANRWYLWVLLGLVQGIFCNMHFQFVFIFFFTTLFIFLMSRKNKNFWKYFIFYIGSFVITFTPLLIFDLRNNFLNTTLFLNFFTKGTDNSPKNVLSWIPVFGNFIQPFTYIRDSLTAVCFFIIMTQLIYYLYKKNKELKLWYKALLIIWILMAVCFSIYGKRPSEYYFMFTLPFIFIVLIDYFSILNQKIFIYIFLIFFFMFNMLSLRKNVEQNYGGLYYKEAVVKYIKNKYEGKNFNISYNGVSVDHGFKYLLEYYDVKQSGNTKDPLIEVSIPAKKNSERFGLYGVTTNF